MPIVEPEVLMDGTHSIGEAGKATGRALQAVYTELHDQRVDLYGTLFKPNMVLSGYEASDRAGVDEVAEATLDVLTRHVPAAVPGIVFLSGGQTDEDATAHLNAMNARGPHPWELSFSYGRALQAPALKAWGGDPAKAEDAQKAFYRRAKFNGAARTGSYAPEMETSSALEPGDACVHVRYGPCRPRAPRVDRRLAARRRESRPPQRSRLRRQSVLARFHSRVPLVGLLIYFVWDAARPART